jgi:hypothetical protein
LQRSEVANFIEWIHEHARDPESAAIADSPRRSEPTPCREGAVQTGWRRC